ncbi:MAG: TrbI/VirB10 family protein, partial [Desulfobacteraceae bacterium]|nr:TrbI/VirB10 family protein [Desulfobacteraceae bacterium]
NIKTKSQKSDIKKVVGKWNEPKTQASLPIDMSRVLTMDRFISAILVPEIDSELSGKVTAQVEQNVYGAHGRKILVPAGTRAIGRYESLKKVGEERLSIRWMRLITPDGINIHCGDAEMVDSMGRVGITGDVDRKYFERYGMSLLVSAITAISTYSVPVRNENQQVVVESFGKEQSSLAKTILEDNLEIKPKM